MRAQATIPLNTLDKALEFAGAVSRDLQEEQSWRMYRIFALLAKDPLEGWIAFLVWKARGQSIDRLLKQG
jgi:hypothetical protein